MHPLISSLDTLNPKIAAAADDIEANRSVPAAIISELSDAGFYRMSVPKEFGGDEVDPLVIMDALEKMAMADASTAWVTMIIAANPLFIGNAISMDVWQELYKDNPDMRSAGTIAPNGRAVAEGDGYRVSGRWKYGSGSEHCEYLISGCMIFEDNRPKFKEDGTPELLWIIHSTDDCIIHKDSWDTTGLRGSSSHDYEVEDLFVPADWTFRIGEKKISLSNPVYQLSTLPFTQLAGIGLGLARRAVDIITEISKQKRRGPLLMSEDPSIQNQIARATALIESSRLYVKDAAGNLLHTLARGDELSVSERASFRLACSNAMDSAVTAIDMMYKIGGGDSIYKGKPLERIFRDIHTAETHIQFNDLTYIKAGRMFLGLDPQDPLF